MADAPLTIALADAGETARLGADLAAAAKPGDVFALSGDLGAGKTTLARGFVRAMAGAAKPRSRKAFAIATNGVTDSARCAIWL